MVEGEGFWNPILAQRGFNYLRDYASPVFDTARKFGYGIAANTNPWVNLAKTGFDLYDRYYNYKQQTYNPPATYVRIARAPTIYSRGVPQSFWSKYKRRNAYRSFSRRRYKKRFYRNRRNRR